MVGGEHTEVENSQQDQESSQDERHNWLDYIKALGPGLISGGSDNDPTTVATLSVVGASTRYGLSWLLILLYPMLASIQMISAQVGVIAKCGLQQAVRLRYGRRWGVLLLLSVLTVNLITLAADLEGGAAALGLLFNVAWQWFIAPFALFVLLILFAGSYRTVERILKYVLLVFVAYIASAFAAHPHWGDVLHDTVFPTISSSTYIQAALALLGTTLTSYAYVWETIEEAEEDAPVSSLGLARADAGFGVLFAVTIFWFILISTGATLGVHHQQVQTAQQAAEALRPVAGPLASDLFGIGLLASAILAVPVLAATSAYMVSEECEWRGGLSRSVWEARGFYAVVVASLLVGVLISYLGISPIQLLFYSGIAGGLGTPISLAFLLITARDHGVMQEHPIGKVLTAVGWATTLLITAISAYYLWQQLGSSVHV